LPGHTQARGAGQLDQLAQVVCGGDRTQGIAQVPRGRCVECSPPLERGNESRKGLPTGPGPSQVPCNPPTSFPSFNVGSAANRTSKAALSSKLDGSKNSVLLTKRPRSCSPATPACRSRARSSSHSSAPTTRVCQTVAGRASISAPKTAPSADADERAAA